MAGTSDGSLRIVKSQESTEINPAGYISLTEDYFHLTDAELSAIIGNNVKAIEFLKKSGRFVKDKKNRIIDKTTNKIKFLLDEDSDEDGKTRTHIVLPSEHLTNADKLAYLDDYIGIIKSFPNAEDARKFLFALMMITKCR